MSFSNLKKNPLVYIQHLDHQAKIKRMKSITVQSEKEQREQNFQLFFSGANEIKAKKKYQKNQENSKSPYIRKVPVQTTNQNRKRWGTPSTPDMLKEFHSNIQTPKLSPRRLSVDFNFVCLSVI